MAISKNILVVGPYYKKDGLLLSISPHNAEVGVVKALKELGHEVSILDCRNTTFVNSLDHISSCNDVVSLIKGKITDCMFDIILVMGPKLPDPLILSGVWDNIKALKVLWTSEPIKLPEYKQLIIKNKDYFDQIFTFDESEISIYESLGIKAKLLLQAANPDWYRPLNSDKIGDLCFVGSIGGKHANRIPFIQRLARNFRISVYDGIFDAVKVNKIYNEHKLVVNLGLYIKELVLPLKSSGLQQRVFESCCAGVPCISHEIPYKYDGFIDKEHMGFFNENNLEDVVSWFLVDKNRMVIEKNLIENRDKYTYKFRMKQFLEAI